MNSPKIRWSQDAFILEETGHVIEDKDVLEIMDRSARESEVFVSLPRADVFPLRNGERFEDWRIRLITHGPNRYVKLYPVSERTVEIVKARKVDWMRANFSYDDLFIKRYVDAGYGLPRAWISSTIRLVIELSDHIPMLRMVVGKGDRIRDRLKPLGIVPPGDLPSKDIITALEIVECMESVTIFRPS